MFDDYVLRFIKSFLKKCDICDKNDVLNSIRFCCYCNKYNCNSCKMVRDYTPYETTDLYCEKCHKELFI